MSSPYINGNVHAATGKTKLLMYLTAFIAQFCRNFKAKAQLPSFPSPSLPLYFAAYLRSGVLQRGEHKFDNDCRKNPRVNSYLDLSRKRNQTCVIEPSRGLAKFSPLVSSPPFRSPPLSGDCDEFFMGAGRRSL